MADFLKSSKSIFQLTVLILILFTFAFVYQGNNIEQPTILRKVSQWTGLGGFGEQWDQQDVTTSTTTELFTSTTTMPALILRRNFDRHYDLGEIHVKRRNTIERVCDKSKHGYYGKSKGSTVAKRLVIDHRHHLVYCAVQKVGSTFLRSLLKIVNSQGVKNIDNRWKSVNKKEPQDLTQFHYFLSSSFKMMFVREPYSRLFSGYTDKLFTVNTFYWKITGTYIKNEILNHGNKSPSTCGHDITFPQFIKYVIESEKTGRHTDRHFTPIYEHCRPCQIPYDFIGKMETFANDSLILLNAWNKRYGINIAFDDFEAETALQRAVSHTGRLYSMRENLEKCMSFYSGMQRIWRDLQIRGILPKSASLPFTESESVNVDRSQLIDALTNAIKGVTDRAGLRQQKREAMIQAYGQVPMKDLIKLREVVRPDCELFGYDVSPDYIFNRTDTSGGTNSFNYFDLWNDN
ncbi:carbohydrate sulfotransferase 11-like [Ylistrum balloti]|uniref:carbohydrate sulfotransferase 11-like n=1 Tax=Ylistrum balloti TaxID=509963 RepID=UPI0029058A6D|nr:carbohydrate sulfotransferase 11-like [Ylistrum balloti]